MQRTDSYSRGRNEKLAAFGINLDDLTVLRKTEEGAQGGFRGGLVGAGVGGAIGGTAPLIYLAILAAKHPEMAEKIVKNLRGEEIGKFMKLIGKSALGGMAAGGALGVPTGVAAASGSPLLGTLTGGGIGVLGGAGLSLAQTGFGGRNAARNALLSAALGGATGAITGGAAGAGAKEAEMTEKDIVHMRGFMDKCAELGVDSAQLMKQALNLRGASQVAEVPLNRLWQLLSGSRAKSLGEDVAKTDRFLERSPADKMFRPHVRGEELVIPKLGPSSGSTDELAAAIANNPNYMGAVGRKQDLLGLRDTEKGKVLGTRLGTGAAASIPLLAGGAALAQGEKKSLKDRILERLSIG